MEFILNEETISTDLPPGTTVLDFVRYHKSLKGTKIGCREGDCGACTILVGELTDNKVRYRSMTSCLMPLANAIGKHIVTIEGINPADGSLTPVQQAMVDESGTQCGFCTVGFVMSLTGFCLGAPAPSPALLDQAIAAIDGNICRCTGYKSIERAACRLSEPPAVAGGLSHAIDKKIVPDYFLRIVERLSSMQSGVDAEFNHPLPQVVPTFVGGGTDVYVQRPEHMAETESRSLFYADELRGIHDIGEFIEIGASATVTDLLESPLMTAAFPNLYNHLKLVSSTPIRNMATLAGNFVNASPIGDMTVWFLALDSEIVLSSSPPYAVGGPTGNTGTYLVPERGVAVPTPSVGTDGVVLLRTMKLRDLYLGYKQLSKQPEEIITKIRFKKPTGDFRFNFEKVCKRTYLDIATVNTAISLSCSPPYAVGGVPDNTGTSFVPERGVAAATADGVVLSNVHVAAGGVAPIPLYLKETSEFLRGKDITEQTIAAANEIMQSEISPISDVRGTEQYKRLLLRQLFRAHFIELFSQREHGDH